MAFAPSRSFSSTRRYQCHRAAHGANCDLFIARVIVDFPDLASPGCPRAARAPAARWPKPFSSRPRTWPSASSQTGRIRDCLITRRKCATPRVHTAPVRKVLSSSTLDVLVSEVLVVHGRPSGHRVLRCSIQAFRTPSPAAAFHSATETRNIRRYRMDGGTPS